MKKLMALITLIATMTTFQIGAHENHDHGAPTIQAPKGGILKATHNAYFELVKSGQLVKIYVYDQKGQNLSTTQFKVEAELEIPRKKTTKIQLKDLTTHWESPVDHQGSHRFTVKLKIVDAKGKDDVQFTIENK